MILFPASFEGARAAADQTATPPVDSPACQISPGIEPGTRPHAALYAPSERQRQNRRSRDNADAESDTPQGRNALSDDPTPALQPQTAACTNAAAEHYRKISEDGGWPTLSQTLKPDAAGDEVAALRRRLAIEGDLKQQSGPQNQWDEALTQALKHFQWRAGLQQSGEVDQATLDALNISAATRARQLAASAQRIAGLTIPFDEPHVIVNIPSASVEAVDAGHVVERHAAVAGDVNHRSPQITARITGITINPTWTLPRSIIENEVFPKLKHDPNYLRRAKIRILDSRGHQISLRHIDWSRAGTSGLLFRQDPGRKNSLGTLRIDMPNKEAVYMHDTPTKRSFADNYRFLSHGCVRVDHVYRLAEWLLHDAEGKKISDDDIRADVDEKRQIKIAFPKAVSVAWIYLDAWESADGTAHFRPDVYNLDTAQDINAASTPQH